MLTGILISIVFGMYCSGIFNRTSYLDSPNIPPISMPGFEAEKKTGERDLSESQRKYTILGNCSIPKGQYSQLVSLIKKLLRVILLMILIRHCFTNGVK